MNAGGAEDYKMSDEELIYHIIGLVLSQKFSLMDFIKNFGKPGDKAIVKELTQLHDMTTFTPLYPKKLTR